MEKKKNAGLDERLGEKKESEVMINVIKENINKGNKYVSFDLKDGYIKTVFIKTEEKKIDADKKEKDERLNYIG